MRVADRVRRMLATEPLTVAAPRVARLLWLEARRRWHNATGGAAVSVGGERLAFGFETVEELLSLRYTVEEEATFLETFAEAIRPTDTVWDVGANVGVHGCLAATLAGRVVCVEPYEPNRRRLRANLRRNGLSCRIVEAALGAEPGEAALSVPDTASPGDQWVALVPAEGYEPRNTTVTEKTTGDRLVAERGLPSPDVVKVDVEGATYEVLDGMSTLLDGACRRLFVEVHEPSPVDDSRPAATDFGHTPAEIERLLSDHGYEVRTLTTRRADRLLDARAADAASD